MRIAFFFSILFHGGIALPYFAASSVLLKCLYVINPPSAGPYFILYSPPLQVLFLSYMYFNIIIVKTPLPPPTISIFAFKLMHCNLIAQSLTQLPVGK